MNLVILGAKSLLEKARAKKISHSSMKKKMRKETKKINM